MQQPIPRGLPADRADEVIAERVTAGPPALPVRNRIQWGPILGGIATAVAVLLVLGALGLAVGLSAFKPNTSAAKWGTGAGIWGGITALIAFFCGGWVAAKAAAVGGSGSALLNGFVTGAATLALVVVLAVSGVTNVLGFVGNNVASVAAITAATGNTTQTQQAQGQAKQAATQAQQAASNPSTQQKAYNDAKAGAWGTFVAFVLALLVAALGGWAGSNTREELMRRTRTG